MSNYKLIIKYLLIYKLCCVNINNISRKGGIFDMKIKKIAVAILTMAMVTASSVMAFAANGVSADEQKILDKLSSGVTVNGTAVKVPAEYVNQAEKYLAANDVTADQVTSITSKIDDAYAVAKSENVTDLTKLSKDAKQKVLADAQAAAKVVGVTVTYDAKTGAITGKTADGSTVLTGSLKSDAASGSTTAASSSNGVIKATGFGVSATVAVAVALVAGLFVCSVVADKKKLFA